MDDYFNSLNSFGTFELDSSRFDYQVVAFVMQISNHP